jgi:hypothetical protein
MARQAAPDYAAIAKDRWDTLTIGVEGLDAQSTNSDILRDWMASTREILARMVHGTATEEEYQLLCDAEERLLSALGDEATKLVAAIEPMRRPKVVAA